MLNDNIWKQNLKKLKHFKNQFGSFNVPPNWKEDRDFSRWVENIRKHPDKFPLKVREALKNIGFDFKFQADWNYMYSLLEEFRSTHGHSHVPPLQAKYELLFDWTNVQRKSKSRLTKEQIKKLDKLNFEWVTQTDKDLLWQKRFEELLEFKSQYGHTRVPSTFENKSLAGWVSKQRENEKSLSFSRKTILNGVGFVWYSDMKKLDELAWLEKYEQLKSFGKKHGHLQIPSQDPKYHSLRIWVDHQRAAEKKLPTDRKKMLDKIKFRWKEDIKSDLIASWNAKYKELIRYRNKFGDCLVSSHSEDYPELARWVSRHRMRWNLLDTETRRKLKKIGFVTSAEIEEANKKKWMAMLALLKRFKKVTGHCRVPSTYEENPELGRWVEVQRSEERKLPAWKKDLLDAIGFAWSSDIKRSKEARWNEMYGRLKKFHKRFGHASVPEYWKEDEELSIWVMSQRRPKVPLSREKRALLKRLSFRFVGLKATERKRNKLGYFANET